MFLNKSNQENIDMLLPETRKVWFSFVFESSFSLILYCKYFLSIQMCYHLWTRVCLQTTRNIKIL